jgi:hypothetical protein
MPPVVGTSPVITYEPILRNPVNHQSIHPSGQINVTPVIEQVLIPNIIEVNIKIDLSRWNCGMNILSTRVQKEQKSEKRQQFFHHQKDYPIITCFVQLLFSFLAESIENSYIFES